MSGIQKALITGGNGNLGRLVASRLRERGIKIVRFDLPATSEISSEGDEIVLGDIRDKSAVMSMLEKHQPNIVYHLASLLSGSSEEDIEAAWAINANASFDLLRASMATGVHRFFFASTVATYGDGLADPLPQDAEQWPANFYGASKVAVERLGVYFKLKHGLDFRCLRFPLVISPFAPKTAVTAYPSHAIRAAHAGERFVFPVSPGVGMSTLFLEDVIRSIVEYSLADANRLSRHTYNLHGYHVTAEAVATTIRRRFQNFEYDFAPDPVVETLLSGWPDVMADNIANKDWDWKPAFNFAQSADRMCELLDAEKA